MIKKLKIKSDTKEKDILLFDEITNLHKINILFGGNGVGKSTFLNGLKNGSFELETTNPIHILSYKNSEDNKKVSKYAELTGRYDILKVYNSSAYSEGQGMIHFLLPFLYDVKDVAKENADKDIVVLIDEIDSGLSIENINMMLHIVCEIGEEYKNVQFFISSNHYHYAYVFKKVLSMYDGQWITIESYEDYFERLNDGIKIMHDANRDFSFLNVY